MKQVTIIRAVLELTSPLSIGTGEATDLRDATIFTDASGCPMIPGTSLAGVLRAAWRELYGEASTNDLFGATPGRGGDDANAVDSCINVSCGVLHNQNDTPVQPCQTPDQMSKFVRASRSVTTRQHVRIDDKGTAARRGLYDRDMVPKGHRFTVEIRFNWPDAEEQRVLDTQAIPEQLLSLLDSPFVTLGGRSRSGLGQFAVKRAWMRTFNLADKGDFKAFCDVPVALWEQDKADKALKFPVNLKKMDKAKRDGWVTLEVAVRPRKSWLIAGNTPDKEDERDIKGQDQPKLADMVPWRESRVEWNNERGSFDPETLKVAVPASSIKGPIRHRTAFYLNASQGHFAEGLSRDERRVLDAQNHTELWKLFGGIPFAETHETSEQFVGKVIFEDVELMNKGEQGFQDHVTLDRFRGGALSGHLFDESFRWGGLWKFRLHIKDPYNQVPADVRRAFARALEDLEDGCLQFGAGDARGHGRMDVVELKWSDKKAWLNGEPEPSQQEGEAA